MATRSKQFAVAVRLVVCGWVCVLGLLSVRQIQVWKDSASLWENNIRVNTTSPSVYGNYGQALIARGRYQEALEVLRRAVKLSPNNVIALNNLGIAMQSLGMISETEAVFQEKPLP